jgi:hypothetical protein
MTESRFGELPRDLKDAFETLSDDITWTNTYWYIYRQLFRTSENYVDIMNQCAPNFFLIVQQALVDLVILRLFRLGDPVKQKGRKNLSLEIICNLVKTQEESGLTGSLRPIVANFKELSNRLKEYRDKKLAHLNLMRACGNGSLELPPVTFKMIEDALSIVYKFMNKINGHYRNSTTVYSETLLVGDGNDVVSCLLESLRYRELQKELQIPYDDLEKCTWYKHE